MKRSDVLFFVFMAIFGGFGLGWSMHRQYGPLTVQSQSDMNECLSGYTQCVEDHRGCIDHLIAAGRIAEQATALLKDCSAKSHL